MTNNDERREIATILRGLDERIDGLPLMCTEQEHDAMVLRAIRAVIGNGDIFHRLADLIDRPTCHMTKKGSEFILAGWWECSECGPVYPPCNDEIAVWALQKCPRCGAEVVNDDD